MLARSVWSRGRVVSRTAQRFEKLVADGTADDELVVRMALARRGVDDPLRAMHEAKMLPQVLAELSEIAEWYAMPETARSPALEQSIAHYARDYVVGRSIVRELQPGGLYDSEALESPRLPALRVRLNARIRPGVDQSPTGCENPVHLDQGIDHALWSDSSKCPREDHQVEGCIWIRQMLRRARGEAHVSNTRLARVPFRGSNGLGVGINSLNPCGERRDPERQAAIAAPEIQDALPAHERRAAPLPELVVRTRAESRRQCGDVPAEAADGVLRDTAHRYVQIKPGRAGEIRTRGLLVPN